MRHYEHTTIATALYIAVGTILGILSINAINIITYGIYLIGVLSPDIDHKDSYIVRALPRIIFNNIWYLLLGIIFVVVLVYNKTHYEAYRYIYHALIILATIPIIQFVLVYIVPGVIRHRGPLHTPIMGAIFTIAMYAVTRNTGYSVAYYAGWNVHLVQDMFTGRGIPVMWPIDKRRKVFLRDETKQRVVTNVVVMVSSGVMLVYIFSLVGIL